jgi:DNA polymerase-3 subunit gamma/tau
VDDVREIIEAVRYAPSPGKHRIFVVDEVHMLSTPAFNALLKTLEEPPPRSVFLFATTNPEKIPFTVTSRCQRYDLRRLPAREVVARLREIAGAEQVEVSDASLLAIAREGEGSLRDSLTLLDQILAHGGGRVEDAVVAEVLDLIDHRLVLALASACVAGDPAAALEACGRAAAAGIDAKRLAAALMARLRDLVVLRVAPDAPQLVEGSDAELEELRALAGRAEPARLRRMFRALLREQEDLAWAPEPFAVLELALVRCATLPAGDEVGELVARLRELEKRLGGGEPPDAAGGGRPGPAPGRARGADRGPGMPRAGRADPEDPRDAPRAGGSGPPPPDEAAAAAPEAPLEVVYDRLAAFAQQENRGLFAALAGGRLVSREPGRLRIRLASAIAARRLAARGRELEAVCERFFGEPVRVELEAGSGDAVPARPRADGAADDAALLRRKQRALDHPGVNAALEVLGGEIVEIRPLGEDG